MMYIYTVALHVWKSVCEFTSCLSFIISNSQVLIVGMNVLLHYYLSEKKRVQYSDLH